MDGRVKIKNKVLSQLGQEDTTVPRTFWWPFGGFLHTCDALSETGLTKTEDSILNVAADSQKVVAIAFCCLLFSKL